MLPRPKNASFLSSISIQSRKPFHQVGAARDDQQIVPVHPGFRRCIGEVLARALDADNRDAVLGSQFPFRQRVAGEL